MTVKISDLTPISGNALISVTTAQVPVIAGNGTVDTYKTGLSDIKTYVSSGNLTVSGNIISTGGFFYSKIGRAHV